MPLLCSATSAYHQPGQAAKQQQNTSVREFQRSCESLQVPASSSVPCEFLRVPVSSSVPMRGDESKRQWPSIIKNKYTSFSYCKFANFVKLVQASSDPSDHLPISFSLLIFVVCYMDAFVVYRFTIHNVHSAFLFSPRSFGFYYLPFNCQQKNQTKVNKRSGLWVLKSTPYFYLCWRFYFLPLVSPVARPNTTRRSGSAIPQSSRNPNCSWPCKNL